jgi:ABC-type nitrate/sulfonate/bicarbonate transport system permease component
MTGVDAGVATRRPGFALYGVAGFAALLVLVEALPRLGAVSPSYLPPTSRIASALVAEAGTGSFWSAVADTLIGWALGLLIAVVAGVVVGVVIGSVPLLRALTASTVEFLRPIPSVALIPLAVLLYGTALQSTTGWERGRGSATCSGRPRCRTSSPASGWPPRWRWSSRSPPS